jgi:hypothetical protein
MKIIKKSLKQQPFHNLWHIFLGFINNLSFFPMQQYPISVDNGQSSSQSLMIWIENKKQLVGRDLTNIYQNYWGQKLVNNILASFHRMFVDRTLYLK